MLDQTFVENWHNLCHQGYKKNIPFLEILGWHTPQGPEIMQYFGVVAGKIIL